MDLEDSGAVRWAAVPLVVMATIMGIAGCSAPEDTAGAPAGDPENAPYDPASLFKMPIPRGAPTDARSAGVIGGLRSNLDVKKIVATADEDTPPVYVGTSKDPVFSVRVGARNVRVYTPRGVAPGGGSDHPLVVLNPRSPGGIRYLEVRLWRASVDADRRRLHGEGVGLFHYNNDGRRLNPDRSRSVSVPFAGDGTGSGLSYLAGLIRPEEVASGEIPHAIRFSYSCTDASARYRSPAVRTDQPHPQCSGDTGVTPDGMRMDMGMRLQLDPSVKCARRTVPGAPGRSTSRETRFLRIVCRALQRYGMIMMDGAGPDAVVLYMENDRTAGWGRIVGSPLYGSYGWILRDQSTPDDGLARSATSGIPWGRMRVVAP